jgi:hypothetical protein
LVLTVVFLALLHDLLMVFIVNTLHWTKYIVRFTNMLYYFPAGLVCIAYIALLLPYFNRAARSSQLLQKSTLVLGILVLLIGLVQLSLIGYGFLQPNSVNLLLAGAETLAGAALLFLALRRPKQFTG